MTIWLLLSGVLSLDLLLAIMTLQKFTGKEIRNGILGSFNIFDKVTDKVGGITCKEKNYRTVRDGGNPTKMAVATIKGEGDTALEAEAQLYSYIT